MDFGLYLLLFFLGTIFGSFLNAVADRFRSGQTMTGRSKCEYCHRRLRFWELIPLVSYVLLKGRCATCHHRLSLQYIIVELLTGVLFILAWMPLPVSTSEIIMATLITAIMCWLIILFIIDLHTLLLPDRYIIGLSLVVLLYLSFAPLKPDLLDSIWGSIVGAGFLLTLWLITRGRGLGLGDVKLLVPLGALLGVFGVILLLWIAFTLGGLVGVYLLIRSKAHLKTALPFGPFLAGAAIIVLLFPVLVDIFFSFTLGIR